MDLICSNCYEEFSATSIFSLKNLFEEKGGFLYFESDGSGYFIDAECPSCNSNFQKNIK